MFFKNKNNFNTIESEDVVDDDFFDPEDNDDDDEDASGEARKDARKENRQSKKRSSMNIIMFVNSEIYLLFHNRSVC